MTKTSGRGLDQPKRFSVAIKTSHHSFSPLREITVSLAEWVRQEKAKFPQDNPAGAEVPPLPQTPESQFSRNLALGHWTTFEL